MRIRPTAKTTAAVASFAYQRRRPGTTSRYIAPTRTATSAVIGSEGEEKPSQWAIAVTSNGRGRAASEYKRVKTISITARLTRKTTRCRHLRKKPASPTDRSPRIGRAHREPIVFRKRAIESSHAVRAAVT